MKLFRSLFVVLLCSALQAKPLHKWLADAQKRIVTQVLPNGLTVVCYPMPGVCTVRVGIAYDVGAKDEKAGEYGLAHMIEHMIFKGTDKMSEVDLKEIAEKFCIGGVDGGYQASTARDTTRYYFQSDKNNYGVFLDILADCMFNVRFDEHHFASEVKTVIQELNDRRSELMVLIAYDALSAMFYPFGHPYHHATGGLKETLLEKTTADLKEFYKRNYHPSRAVLTIIGDIDAKQALVLARKAFNKEVAVPERVEAAEKPVLTSGFGRKKVVAYKPIGQPVYHYGWRIPAGDELATQAICTADILSNRLLCSVVREKDLAVAIAVHPIPERLGTLLWIEFTPKEGRSIKEIKAAITEELTKLMTEGPTDNEVACVKKSSERRFLQAFETASGVGDLIEDGYFPDRDIGKLFSDFEYAKSLTPELIKTFVQEHLRPLLRSTVIFLPIPEEEKEHWAALRAEEDTYEKTILEQKSREAEVEPARYALTLPEPQLVEFISKQPDKVFTLSNGLIVCVKRRDSTPFISGSLCFKNNELLDITLSLAGKKDLAALGLVFINWGTEAITPDQVREFFELLGANCSFGVDGCSFSCPSDALSSVTGRVVTLMKQPKYDEQLLAQQIQSRIQKIQMSKMVPGYVAGRLLILEFEKDYPWTKTDEQICANLQAITRNDLVAFNKEYLRPDTMCLVLVGNIDLATIEQDLEKSFGTWKAPGKKSWELIKKEDIPVITNPAPKEIVHTIPVDQVMFVLARITTFAETDDMYALKIIESYLAKQLFGIRERTGLFYSGQKTLTDETVFSKGYGIIAYPLSVTKIEAGEAAIKLALAEIAKNGIPQEFITKAQQTTQMSLVKAFSSNGSLCNSFAHLMQTNKQWDTYEKRLARIQSLTKKQVDAVAKKYLDPKEWTTIKVGRVGNDGDEE